MSTITLKDLPKEEQDRLLNEAKQELLNSAENQKLERERYKQMVSNEVNELFEKMKLQCDKMRIVKTEMFNSIQVLIETKKETYSVKGDQKTHTLSNEEGTRRITVGYRDVSDWDGTEDAGVEKVKKYIATLAKDEVSGQLVDMVNAMLKPDKRGNLDPRRVMELAQLAEKSANAEFIDGVSILMKAYRVVKSKSIILVEERTSGDKWRNIELDFSDLVITETQTDKPA